MSNNIHQIKRVITLALLCAGVLPFVSSTGAHAQKAETKNRWLDDYSAPVGFTYGAQARVQAAYLWRGLYAGGPNIQTSANVGYGGLYADLWWNIGATDATFKAFQPEMDLSIGFQRWGLNAYLLYIHNFNCGMFDFGNYPDKGNRLEVNVQYTLSSKIPLSILWGTRVAASDGYTRDRLAEDGTVVTDTLRAWSSYAEISYKQALPHGMSIYGAFGITPWRSCYTGYQGGFAVQNIELRVRKDWDLLPRLGLMLQGQVVISPSAMSSIQSGLHANATVGVYLK